MINEGQSKVIQRIFDEYLSGKSHKAIAKGLTEDEIVSPGGQNSWNTQTVDYILRSEKSLGNILFQKSYSKDYLAHKTVRNQGEFPQYLIEDHHPAIIELETFEAAQQERERRKRGIHNTKKHANQDAFFKTFYCATCGNLVHHSSNSVKQADGKQKVYHYWRCQVALGQNFSSTCDAQSYREEIIEKNFMDMLQEMKAHPHLIMEAKQVIQETGIGEEEQGRMEELRNKIKDHYHDLYEKVEANREHDDFDINSTEIKEVTDNIMAIEKELESYNERIEKANQMQDDLNWLLEELETIKKYHLRRRSTFRDDIFSRLIKRGEVHEDGRIVYDLCLGIKWTAYGNEKRMSKAKDSIPKK
ncbi:recombinase family protein [Bacillaceae bacterium S4-13-56]